MHARDLDGLTLSGRRRIARSVRCEYTERGKAGCCCTIQDLRTERDFARRLDGTTKKDGLAVSNKYTEKPRNTQARE